MATIPTIPRVTPGGPAAALGQFKQIIDGVTAGGTRTLSPDESGATCLFDAAAGMTYVLPPASANMIGCWFEFQTRVTITSNSAKVITGEATTFLTGGVGLQNSGATTGQFFAANGTTHRSVNGNGTTTGGIVGDSYRVKCVSATLWIVDGVLNQTGTAATPFATT